MKPLATIVRSLLHEQRYTTLFHATSLYRAYEILRTDTLFDSSFPWGTSFSRSKSFWYEIHEHPIRLVLNGAKLEKHYKLKPYVYAGYWKSEKDFEYEVRSPAGVAIRDVSRYLLAIEIMLPFVSWSDITSLFGEYDEEKKDVLREIFRSHTHVPLYFYNRWVTGSNPRLNRDDYLFHKEIEGYIS